MSTFHRPEVFQRNSRYLTSGGEKKVGVCTSHTPYHGSVLTLHGVAFTSILSVHCGRILGLRVVYIPMLDHRTAICYSVS